MEKILGLPDAEWGSEFLRNEEIGERVYRKIDSQEIVPTLPVTSPSLYMIVGIRFGINMTVDKV